MGHLAPKNSNYRINKFNFIELPYNLYYNKEHNLVYNRGLEAQKMANGLPSIYTDTKFNTENDYSYILFSRNKNVSLKSCIRKVNSIKGIPKGTIITFSKNWYIPNKKIRMDYHFKVKTFNDPSIVYQINLPSFKENFTACKRSQTLVEALRKNGFLVNVFKNTDFLIGEDCGGEIAIVYGCGKQIGFSSQNTSFQGYQKGIDNILWDFMDWFDKWSKCELISKDAPVNDIIEILKIKREDWHPA